MFKVDIISIGFTYQRILVGLAEEESCPSHERKQRVFVYHLVRCSLPVLVLQKIRDFAICEFRNTAREKLSLGQDW